MPTWPVLPLRSRRSSCPGASRLDAQAGDAAADEIVAALPLTLAAASLHVTGSKKHAARLEASNPQTVHRQARVVYMDRGAVGGVEGTAANQRSPGCVPPLACGKTPR